MNGLKPLAAPLEVPLVLDWDGTLHLGDMNLLALKFLLQNGAAGCAARFFGRWLWNGKAYAKLKMEQDVLARSWQPRLCWIDPIVAWALAEEARGRAVWVATGTSQKLVEQVVRAQGWGWPVLGTSQPGVNLVSAQKARALVAQWGERGFIYAGNSEDDLAVWRVAQAGVVVKPLTPRILPEAQRLTEVVGVVE